MHGFTDTLFEQGLILVPMWAEERVKMLELGCWDEVLSTISSSHSTNCSFGLFGRRGE